METDMNKGIDRRSFFKLAGAGIAVAGLASLGARPAMAEDKLSPSDATATALKYTEDAATVKAADAPSFKAGQACANCVLYAAAQEKGGYAPCGAFGGKLVAGKGWCAAYTPKG